jgi:hypothetical protein
MGSALGLYNDDEIKHLTEEDKQRLRMHIIEALRDTGILKNFLDGNPDIKQALRDEVPLSRIK